MEGSKKIVLRSLVVLECFCLETSLANKPLREASSDPNQKNFPSSGCEGCFSRPTLVREQDSLASEAIIIFVLLRLHKHQFRRPRPAAGVAAAATFASSLACASGCATCTALAGLLGALRKSLLKPGVTRSSQALEVCSGAALVGVCFRADLQAEFLGNVWWTFLKHLLRNAYFQKFLSELLSGKVSPGSQPNRPPHFSPEPYGMFS